MPKKFAQKFHIKILFVWNDYYRKNNDKDKHVYSGNGILFDGKDSWSFNDDFARNVIIFGVDNSPSSHTDSLKNNFSILAEGDSFGINGSFGGSEKKKN